MDSIPHVESEPKWIIFRGALLPHLGKGKLTSLPIGQYLDPDKDMNECMKVLNARQEDAIKIFSDAVVNKEGAYTDHYITCTCNAK